MKDGGTITEAAVGLDVDLKTLPLRFPDLTAPTLRYQRCAPPLGVRVISGVSPNRTQHRGDKLRPIYIDDNDA